MSARIFAAMHPSRSVAEYVKEARVVTNKTKGNADLTNPPVPLPLVVQHIQDLDDASQAAHNGSLGMVTDRDSKLVVVQSDMEMYRAYAESIANANPERGPAIIEGAGFYVVKRTRSPKPELAVKYAKTPGGVKLVAKAKKHPVSYFWQMSTNQTTWNDLPESHVASMPVSGLTPGATYAFRLRTLTKDGLSDWSAPVVIMAH
jgi:hypothetical protein